MAQRRWLIAVGALILAGMLACGAFCLGIYVGKYGLTGEGLRAAFQGRAAQQPAAAAGRPDVVGRLRRVMPEALDLATASGPRRIELTPGTQFVDERGAALTAEDLLVGDLIAVFGELGGDGARSFAANLVVRLPPQPTRTPGTP